MSVQAVLFDLGNTLVGYYTADEFPVVLRRCLRRCVTTLGRRVGEAEEDGLLRRALELNTERSDLAVRPLGERLQELFGRDAALDDGALQQACGAFLEPIFALAKVDPEAIPVLESLRARGIKTAIVSNTPWGSAADAWRKELARHRLLESVDAAVFCGDVGWRKPHRAPFQRALELLGVVAADAIFVGDDPRWDVAGARQAGLRPVLVRSLPTDTVEGLVSIASLSEIPALLDETAAGFRKTFQSIC